MTKTTLGIILTLLVIVLVGMFIYSLKPSPVNDYTLEDTATSTVTANPASSTEAKVATSTNQSVGAPEPTTPNDGSGTVKPPEGSAIDDNQSLESKKWVWVKASSADGSNLIFKKPEAFTITFNKDKTFSATTDCNGIGGKYEKTVKALSFSEMVSTEMFCEGSNEADFSQILLGTSAYTINKSGELIMIQKNGGLATFK